MHDTRGLEVFSHEEKGYRPQIDYDTWRVALLNANDMYLPQNVSYYDRHLLTDEVFILLSGSAAILTAGDTEKPENPTVTWMEEGKVFNVKKNFWHTLYTMPGSRLAIIENRNTCVDNSPRYYFSEEEKKTLLPLIEL